MDQKIKQLLLQTLSPIENTRNDAEAQLKSFEKNLQFINFLQHTMMKDTDKIVQQTSSIYFMNMMERNWKSPEIKSVVADLEQNIVSLLRTEDKFPKVAYLKILHCIFEQSEREIIENLFVNSSSLLMSSELADNKAVLVLYEELFRSESLKFNSESILEIIFNQSGNIFINKFTEYLQNKTFNLAALCMKIVAKSYMNYSLPEFLNRIEVAKGFFDLANQILCIQDHNDDGLVKIQRWAAYFLYKFSNKGLKKYFKNGDLVEFVRNKETLVRLFTTFMMFVEGILNGKKHHTKSPVICADFFSLFAGNKRSREFIVNNYKFLITSFILPYQEYNDKIKEDFEYDASEYLRDRYNYNGCDLRSSTAELFEEIIRCNKDVESDVISSLINFLNAGLNDKNVSCYYGIIGLLANSQKNLINVLGESGYHDFIRKHIFPNIISPHQFIISQSLYFLSLSEQLEISDNSVLTALNMIVSYTNSTNEIISVEACLSLNVFFYNSALKEMFKPIISKLFEKVLLLSKVFFIESLSVLMDSIIDCFGDEITLCAPEFVNCICSAFMSKIEDEDKDKVATISGYLTTIEKLVITAEDKLDIVKSIYLSVSSIITYIFQYHKADFYQEAFDLVNSFIFVLKQINDSMISIFTLALSVDKDELSLYPREVGDFIDNYLSFARDSLISSKTLEIIYNIIDLFMPLNSSEYDIYDEDFESACRIIDSLMLNAGNSVHRTNQNMIPAILHKIVNNYDFAASYGSLPIYALESIMNCFIVAPDVSFASLGTFAPRFFSEIGVYRNKMRRVYDKKLFIVFIGHIFKIQPPIALDYKLLVDIFVEMISTLPEAEKKRAKLMESAANDDEDEEYSDNSCESVFEDIYFESILDNFDAYDYSRKTLGNIVPKTFGESFVSSMNETQIHRIQSILESHPNKNI